MMILSDQHVRLGQLWLRLGHHSKAWSAQGQSALIITMSQTLTHLVHDSVSDNAESAQSQRRLTLIDAPL